MTPEDIESLQSVFLAHKAQNGSLKKHHDDSQLAADSFFAIALENWSRVPRRMEFASNFTIDFKPKLFAGMDKIKGVCRGTCKHCLKQIKKGRVIPEEGLHYCPTMFFSEMAESAVTSLIANSKHYFTRLYSNGIAVNDPEKLTSNHPRVIQIIYEILEQSQVIQNLYKAMSELSSSYPLITEGAIQAFKSYSREEASDSVNSWINNKSQIDPASKGILDLLASRSLADCSIIITVVYLGRDVILLPEDDKSWKYPESREVLPDSTVKYKAPAYAYRIKVIDLDLKPLDRLDRYYTDALIN